MVAERLGALNAGMLIQSAGQRSTIMLREMAEVGSHHLLERTMKSGRPCVALTFSFKGMLEGMQVQDQTKLNHIVKYKQNKSP